MLRRLEAQLRRNRSKMATDAAEPQPSSPSTGRRKPKGSERQKPASTTSEVSTSAGISSAPTGSGSKQTNSYSSSSGGGGGGGAISFSSHSSLSSLRESLPENPNIYDISEIRAATNKFLTKRQTSSSSTSSLPSWRCTLRGKEVIIFQRKFHRPTSGHIVREKLSSICKSHHSAIIKLLGVSISGDYLYLVYEYVPGLSLAECLRNPNNPSFTVLSNWMSRIQIATDLADGLDYIHNNTGLKNVRLVHNHIKSSSVIVVEHEREKDNSSSYSAKICHFGTAELCGEAVNGDMYLQSTIEEIEAADDEERDDLPPNQASKELIRSNSVKFHGTRGYMSPEFQYTGIGTLKSDVYAFGVVILELLSGEEAMRFKFDKKTGDYAKISVVDAAREAMEGEGGDDDDDGGGGRVGRLRKWLDKRLKDSFPVEVAEKLTRLALDCVNVEAVKRPDMRRVAGKISKLYLESKNWSDRINVPDFTVSIGPR